MGTFVEVDDFRGRFAVSKNEYTENIIDEYIDYYEPIYLAMVLGVELSKLVIQEAANAVPRIDAIINPFMMDVDCGIVKSDGVKNMLLGFLFFEISTKSLDANKTLGGNTQNVSDNSERLSQINAGIWKLYNIAVDTGCSIQYLVKSDATLYPEYNGQKLEIATWL